jgi:rubrerythrin
MVLTARFQPNGIHHVTIIDNEEELSKAYFDFAFYHSKNAAETYENAAVALKMPEQKSLFLQLAYRKRDVLNRLKMGRFAAIDFNKSAKASGAEAVVHSRSGADLTPHTTLKACFDFAYGKETRTLALYEKMSGAVHHHSIKTLFDYLIESQRGHIRFLDSQLAISNGDLNRPIPETRELEYA